MNKDVYKYSTKKYLHFDKITSFNSKVEKYVYEFEKNPTHSFLPLIFNEINIEKLIRANDLGELKKKCQAISDKVNKRFEKENIDSYYYNSFSQATY